MRHITFSFLICVIAIAAVKYLSKIFVIWSPRKPNNFLMIGIMSSRENFDARESIRQTWTQMINKLDEKYVFLVGKDFCPFPLSDRISNYSCEEWKPFLPSGLNDEMEIESSKLCKYSSRILNSILIFETHHRLIIKRICVLSNIVKTFVRVSLVNLAVEETILSVTFTNNDEQLDTLLCKSVQQFSFPKHFEGKIILHSALPISQTQNCSLKLTDQSQFIIYRSSVNSENISNFCTPVSLVYSLQGTLSLQEHVNQKEERIKDWLIEQQNVEQRLEEESQKFNDILMLDVIDTYRNLPAKLLNFIKWSDSEFNFKYLLKTDDDTFVNLEKVRRRLKNGAPEMNWWWSLFRKNWPVQRFGKWREDNYISLTYPPFPCGAGYVLTQDLVQSLAMNAPHLHCYQGEDVSIGIWLAPYHPELQSNCWDCTGKVFHDGCNIPQLSVKQMYQNWRLFLKSNAVINSK